MPFFLILFLLKFVNIIFGMKNPVPDEPLLINVGYHSKDIVLSHQILDVLKELNIVPKGFSDPADIKNLKISIEQKLIDTDKEKAIAIVDFFSYERGLRRSMNQIVQLKKEFQDNPKPSMLDFLRGLTKLIHEAYKGNSQDELYRHSILGSAIIFGGIMVFVSVIIWTTTRCRWHT